MENREPGGYTTYRHRFGAFWLWKMVNGTGKGTQCGAWNTANIAIIQVLALNSDKWDDISPVNKVIRCYKPVITPKAYNKFDTEQHSWTLCSSKPPK